MSQTVLGHGAYHELLEDVDRDLARKPGDVELLKRRAALHLDHGDWTMGMVDVERAERQGIPAVELDFLRGKALLLGGYPAHAESALAAYLTSHPVDVPALVIHAQALGKLGRHAEAAQEYRQAVQSASMPAEELLVEAAAAFEANGGLAEAVALLRQGLATPELSGSHALLAESLRYELEAGQFDAALARVEALQKTAVRPEPWMARRAQILVQAGRADEAHAAWTALRDHLLALPNLERGTPLTAPLLAEAQRALGTVAPAPVIAPPASSSPPTLSQP